MINKIKSAIEKNKISTWRINYTNEQVAEAYFIKKNLDTRRKADTSTYEVTVFNDFEKDGTKFRGQSSVRIYPELDAESIEKKLADAYYAASFVTNPYYELPKPVCEDTKHLPSKAQDYTVEEITDKMEEALYRADVNDSSWINSAEFFATRSENHIITSTGTDVSFVKYLITGEFVAQAVNPQDVELHQQFSFTDIETEALYEQAKDALETVRARACATAAPKKGNYTLILSGKEMRTLFSFYAERANVAYVYPKYSDYKVGMKVQGENVTGENVNMKLVAVTPYSEEGIPMKDLTLLEDGELKAVYGGARLSYYMGIEPTGNYNAVYVSNGEKSFDELKSEPYLHVVSFSDFHMDSMSGYFGGEIRLAYLYDGSKITPVTGGSINGNFIELQRDMEFTKERYTDSKYDGPLAVRFKNVPVAGEE